MESRQRSYWVVSPNVNNDNRTVGEWRQASVTTHAAFMGYGPDNPRHGQMGPKFASKVARGIEPGDVILIARRYGGVPEVVGFSISSPCLLAASSVAFCRPSLTTLRTVLSDSVSCTFI